MVTKRSEGLTSKQKGTLIGAIVAACTILLGATDVVPVSAIMESPQYGSRISALERGRAVDSTKLDILIENSEYIRNRLDQHFDKHGGK